MSTLFPLHLPETDCCINDACIERIVLGFGRKERFSTLTALFTHVDAPRSAIANRCRGRSQKTDICRKTRKMYWSEPFRCWDMLAIGNLSLALLWHIYRSLPKEALSDENIIYKIGKIIVALPSLTDVLLKRDAGSGPDSHRYASITNKALYADRKSPVSSIFSACDQITELSETFSAIGRQIGSVCRFDSLVIPVIDIDLCPPEQAISLLFAIRNFICCETISFLIITDRDVLARFLISLYDHSLTLDQGRSMLLALFDDWVCLPLPAASKLLDNMDRPLSAKEKEYVISLVNRSGLLGHFPDPSRIYHACNRFNSFIGCSHDEYTIDEYSIGLLLFLLGTSHPDALFSLAMMQNLKQFVHTIRAKQVSVAALSRGRKNARNTTNCRGGNNEFIKEYDHSGKFDEESVRLLSRLFSVLPPSLTDATVAQWIVKIIPFI